MVDRKQRKVRLLVGISGVSGVTYGVRPLEAMRMQPIDTHLLM